MTSVPPDSGPEKRLFVTALREFSNACDVPSLTPSCPFYRVGESGPWCLEECIDLLADYRPLEPNGIEISDGYRVSRLRSRARRGPAHAPKPFDASELQLSDKTRPIQEWRPSSLLLELRDQTSPPIDLTGAEAGARAARVALIIDQLKMAGIDGERLLRGVLVRGMAHAISMRVAIPILLGAGSDVDELPFDLDPGIDDWSARIAGYAREPREWFGWARSAAPTEINETVERVFQALNKIERWLRGLLLDELVVWKCPTAEEFECVVDTEGVVEDAEKLDRWTYDRFVNTYLERWDFDSLLLEWKYVHGEQAAPTTLEAMRTRHLHADEVARIIAARSSSGEERQRDTTMTVAQFVAPALAHLEQGRFSAAAAIFDACRIAAPWDAEAHNNYGFCMIPDDLKAALDALERAAELGMRFEPVNVANRMYVLLKLERSSTALEIASRFSASRGWSRATPGFLWSWEDERTELRDIVDIRKYVADLALRIAHEVADETAIREWNRRLDELRLRDESSSP